MKAKTARRFLKKNEAKASRLYHLKLFGIHQGRSFWKRWNEAVRAVIRAS